MRRLELELSLHPDDARRLPALPELAMPAAERSARPRQTPVRLVWHDTQDGSLAGSGVSLSERRLGRETTWRVERMRPVEPPAGGAVWAPGTPAPLVAEAPEAAGLSCGGGKLPAPLLPLAGLEGRQRTIPAPDGVIATLLQGELRTLTAARPVCRMTLAGARSSVAPMALALADKVRLAVPPATLAAEAYAAAGHPALIPRRQGAPALPPGLSVDDAFAALIAHLLDVILHQAGRAVAGEAPEPVHQMRVAVRRLRSACSLFKRAATCPQLDEAKLDLKAFGQVLGPARDWDVFTAGTCAAVAAALPDDPAVARLAIQAQRRREAGYSALLAYLDSARFRRLTLRLALLAAAMPWQDVPPAAPPDPAAPPPPESETAPLDLQSYAARALRKRLKRVLAGGEHITDLPAADLHAIRLNGKRLRYAAEFFAPLFPGRDTRRFLRRVTALQERLGHLNDGAVAAGLMAEIGQARGYAGGVVRGLVAAGGAGARDEIGRSWKRFRKQEPFWE